MCKSNLSVISFYYSDAPTTTYCRKCCWSIIRYTQTARILLAFLTIIFFDIHCQPSDRRNETNMCLIYCTLMRLFPWCLQTEWAVTSLCVQPARDKTGARSIYTVCVTHIHPLRHLCFAVGVRTEKRHHWAKQTAISLIVANTNTTTNTSTVWLALLTVLPPAGFCYKAGSQLRVCPLLQYVYKKTTFSLSFKILLSKYPQI